MSLHRGNDCHAGNLRNPKLRSERPRGPFPLGPGGPGRGFLADASSPSEQVLASLSPRSNNLVIRVDRRILKLGRKPGTIFRYCPQVTETKCGFMGPILSDGPQFGRTHPSSGTTNLGAVPGGSASGKFDRSRPGRRISWDFELHYPDRFSHRRITGLACLDYRATRYADATGKTLSG